MNNRKHRSIHHDEDAVFPLLETLVCIGISVVLLTLFFTSLTNTYIIHDRPGADLQDKNLGIIELLTGSPGQGFTYNLNWEDDPHNLSALGLGTSPTIEYGIICTDPTNIHADFTWFDYDGLDSDKEIFFDASASVEGGDGTTLYTWWWNWTGNESHYNYSSTDPTYLNTQNFTDGNPYTVRLKVNNASDSDSCTYTVQANTFQTPDIEPWAETDIEAFPGANDQTFGQYDERYFVTYTDLGNDYYLYEIKKKTESSYTILDYDKIKSLSNVPYNETKSALGLNTSEYYVYNFNISISPEAGPTFSYGASHDPPTIVAKDSITREVLIYHKPETSGNTIINSPYYEKGRITFRLFLGGIPPIQS